VRAGEPYVFDMGGGFRPMRRDIEWIATQDAPIAPLLDRLSFTAGQRNWGVRFRYGLFEVSAPDFAIIAVTMGVRLPADQAH
jgi:hypothetical protein